jgi:membrane-associated phospholipid phosphatase
VHALRSIALALLFAVAAPARGTEPPIPLQYNLALDASLTGAMGLSVLLLAIYQPELLPESCHWCTPTGLDVAARNAFVWTDHARTADTLSTVIDAAVPASAFTYLLLSANGRGDLNAGLVDSLLVTEAAAAALLLNQVVKLLVGRKRPYAFYDHDVGYSRNEDNLSFYSGHSSFAFSVVAATVTVAAMRGYGGVGIVAGVGFTMAASIGYLRIAADQHWLTDNLVGAAVGTLVGFAIPRIFHSPVPAPAPGTPTGTGTGMRMPPVGLVLAF